jgi:hypothetical protein
MEFAQVILQLLNNTQNIAEDIKKYIESEQFKKNQELDGKIHTILSKMCFCEYSNEDKEQLNELLTKIEEIINRNYKNENNFLAKIFSFLQKDELRSNT